MMTTMRPFFVLLTLWLTCVVHAQDDKKCSCAFNVLPEDEPGCRVYGQLHTSTLTAWHRASEACLDQLAIPDHEHIMNHKRLLDICPSKDGEGANAVYLVNLFRSSVDLVNASQSQFVEYFEYKNGTQFKLKEKVYTERGDELNCKENERFCWDAIVYYLSTHPKELAFICGTLHDAFIALQQSEQGKARTLLCHQGSSQQASEGQQQQQNSSSEAQQSMETIPSCEPLQSQVQQIKAENPQLQCESFASGPAEKDDIPKACVNTTDTSAAGMHSTGFVGVASYWGASSALFLCMMALFPALM